MGKKATQAQSKAMSKAFVTAIAKTITTQGWPLMGIKRGDRRLAYAVRDIAEVNALLCKALAATTALRGPDPYQGDEPWH